MERVLFEFHSVFVVFRYIGDRLFAWPICICESLSARYAMLFDVWYLRCVCRLTNDGQRKIWNNFGTRSKQRLLCNLLSAKPSKGGRKMGKRERKMFTRNTNTFWVFFFIHFTTYFEILSVERKNFIIHAFEIDTLWWMCWKVVSHIDRRFDFDVIGLERTFESTSQLKGYRFE